MENKICFRSYLLCVHISLHSITILFSVLIIRTVKNCPKIQSEETTKCPNLHETTNPIPKSSIQLSSDNPIHANHVEA